jgi:hypothetical protein
VQPAEIGRAQRDPGVHRRHVASLREGDHAVACFLGDFARQPFHQFELNDGRHDAARGLVEMRRHFAAQRRVEQKLDPRRGVDHRHQ